jgi:nucleoside-diphosphate-sugar epimerase
MKILVAGGAGYVGSSLVPSLIEHGYDVDVIDFLWFGNYLPKSVNVINKDLFKCKKNDFVKYDQVIFLAGLSNDPMAEFSPAMNFNYNAALPAYLCYLAKIDGVKRFIFGSSCSVYGYTIDKMYDEKDPVKSDYPYGISKLQGEHGVMNMINKDFSVITLRNGTVSGYSPRMRFDLIVNTMFKTAITSGEININNPAIWRPIISVKDEVSSYLRAVQADFRISGIFNIASGNYTVGQVGDLVKVVLEEKLNKKIKLNIKNIEDFRNYKVSIEKAKTVLGFAPRYNVEDIINELITHLKEFDNFTDDKYYNINVFKKIFNTL